jgi:hypothetical protein
VDRTPLRSLSDGMLCETLGGRDDHDTGSAVRSSAYSEMDHLMVLVKVVVVPNRELLITP